MKTEKRIDKLTQAVYIAGENLNKKLIVADIATDHGYLAENLSKQNWIEKVIATDISYKCLSKLIELIKLNNLKNIDTFVGDGLLPLEKVDICVVAGVGAFEIIKMLKYQNKTANNTYKSNLFVLQPAQNVVELREWLFNNRYLVLKDYVIEDAGRFYPILIVDVSKSQENDKSLYNLWLGRDNKIDDNDFVLFLKDTLSYLQFLNNLSNERINKDKLLMDKLELKKIIENLLKR